MRLQGSGRSFAPGLVTWAIATTKEATGNLPIRMV